MAMGIKKVRDDSDNVYDTEWYKESVVKAERGNREHVARYDRSFNGIMAKADAKSRDLADGADDNGIGKFANHQASTVADLLVEAGSFSHRAAALQHLLHKPSGQALLARMHKSADQTAKESSNMRSETLESILKDAGPVSVCKGIVDRGRAPCSEAELVASLTKHAGGDRAFARLFEVEESVRSACNIAKAAEFSVFDLQPVVVGGEDARDVNNDQSAAVRAHEEIVRIAREKFPFLPADQAFARVFEDKNYAALAAQAHQRPGPTTVYAMPKAAAYTKSDPVPNTDTAYAELMHKAAELRKAQPELSEAQAFSKIYTDAANLDLAKRERMESAPR
jgi:hypothetical protein